MDSEFQTAGLSSKDNPSSRIIRFLFNLAGTFFLGLGAIGIVVPILPTTPFLLLAVACYYKGSRRLHYWILNNKWFGTYLRNYKEGKGLSFFHKVVSITFLWITIGYSIFYVLDWLLGQIVLTLIAVAVSIHILMLPTFKKSRSERQTDP
jgi:uncharacterized membrane protein YbaN (DUF454 family)